MTYCKHCDKEIENDEWSRHISSEELIRHHSGLEFCKICRISYCKSKCVLIIQLKKGINT